MSAERGLHSALLDESRQLICSISLSLASSYSGQLLERRAAGLIPVTYLELQETLHTQHYHYLSPGLVRETESEIQL